jgi:hypothetical protein
MAKGMLVVGVKRATPCFISLFTFTFSLLTALLCGAQDYYMPRKAAPAPQQYPHFKDSVPKKMYFISVNAGISVPLGGFGEKDTNQFFMIPTNNDSTHAKGFANVGFHINAKGGIYLSQNFGFLAKVGYSVQTFDANTLNNIINGYYYYSISGNYSIWQVMGGAFISLPINESTFFRAEVMLGGIYANYPTATVSNSVESIKFSLSNASDFAYSLNAGIEQVINDNFSFIGSITYTGAELNYPTATYTYLINGVNVGTFYQRYPVSMSYGSLDFSIGLIYHL